MFLIRWINTMRGIPNIPKPPEPLTPALKIWYQYSPTDTIRHFIYSGHPGKILCITILCDNL